MDIGLQKEVGIKIIVQRDARMRAASLTGKVANFCISTLGDLELKRTFPPQLKAVVHRRRRYVSLKS